MWFQFVAGLVAGPGHFLHPLKFSSKFFRPGFGRVRGGLGRVGAPFPGVAFFPHGPRHRCELTVVFFVVCWGRLGCLWFHAVSLRADFGGSLVVDLVRSDVVDENDSDSEEVRKIQIPDISAIVPELIQVPPVWSASDRAYGWRFGVQGVVSLRQAISLLGDVHRSTVWRLAKSGAIRRGELGTRSVYCFYSILRFLQGIEA